MASVYGKTYIKPHESFLGLEQTPTDLHAAAGNVTVWRMPVAVAVQGFSLVVTTTVACDTLAPVLSLAHEAEDGTGEVEICAITIPDDTLAGTVIQRLLQAPVTVAYGRKLVLVRKVEGTDAGAEAGDAVLMPLLRSLGTA